MQADWVSGKSCPPGMWVAPVSPCPHMVESECGLVPSSSHKDTNPVVRVPTLMTSSKPHYLAKAPPGQATMLGVRASAQEFEEDANIQALAGPLESPASASGGEGVSELW